MISTSTFRGGRRRIDITQKPPSPLVDCFLNSLGNDEVVIASVRFRGCDVNHSP